MKANKAKNSIATNEVMVLFLYLIPAEVKYSLWR